MKRLFFKNRVIVSLITILALFIGFASHSIAQEPLGKISGRVVDMDGHPVPKLPIFIAPLEIARFGTSPIFWPDDFSLLHRAQTDGVGRFSITGIPQGSVHFGVLPYNIDKRLSGDFEKNLEVYLSWDSGTLNPELF